MFQLFIALLLNSSVQASVPCMTDPLDPFDPKENAVITTGVYKGQCQDSAHKRTALLISNEVAEPFFRSADIQPSSQFIAVSNVSHLGQFYVALIPIQSVETLFVQMERFPPEFIAAHTQIRVQFQENQELTLVPQSLKNKHSTIKLRDLIFSSEYNAPQGVPYDLFLGANTSNPYFAINHLVTSLADKVKKQVIVEKHQVEQFALNLTPDEIRSFLKNWFNRSARQNMSVMYSTLTRSCTTELHKVIDASVNYAKRGTRKPKHAGFIPVLVKQDLNSRHLLRQGEAYPDLDIEQGMPLEISRLKSK